MRYAHAAVYPPFFSRYTSIRRKFIFKWPTGHNRRGLWVCIMSACLPVWLSVLQSVSHTSFPDFPWLWFQIPGWTLAVSFHMECHIWWADARSTSSRCYTWLFCASFDDVILVSLQARTSWRRDLRVPCLADCSVQGRSFTAICTMTCWRSENNSRRNSDDTNYSPYRLHYDVVLKQLLKYSY